MENSRVRLRLYWGTLSGFDSLASYVVSYTT